MAEDAVLIAQPNPRVWTLTMNRPDKRNSLSQALMEGLQRGLTEAEADPDCRLVVLTGRQNFFCTGMDFEEATRGAAMTDMGEGQQYMSLLKRFASSPKIIISKIEGTVLAGGMGLVAASDLVVATPASRFGLPEALWGLLPANVMPFLIRRVGFQAAYRLTLTTETITAEEAARIGLVDTLSDRPDDDIRRYLLRLGRLDEQTIREAKAYFQKMWFLTEEMEQTAIAELNRLVRTERVQQNIKNYVEYQKFPWET
ncbi:MAG: enoyl-CoA hydratase/isomerase family protein [Anaerolineae bacterium]|nr:enoyl-CoA hydratase/isomerase family protein [Anaerolineae bacterium]